MAFGIFSTFADRAATFGAGGSDALRRVRRLQEEADVVYRASFDAPVGDALLWAQRDAGQAAASFWRMGLFAAPSKTAAKRCLREGGEGLAELLRQEAIHPDAPPLPFGVRL